MEGGGTQNQLPEKSVESVSGEDEHRSVRSVAGVKEIIEIWEKNVVGIWKIMLESGKSHRDLENLANIYILFSLEFEIFH